MDRATRLARRLETTVVNACRADADPADLCEVLLATFGETIDLRGACFHIADPSSGIPTAAFRFGDPPGDFARSIEFEYRRPDAATFADLQRRARPVAALSHETCGTLETSARFREMLQPESCADELRMSFVDRFGVWGHATFFASERFTSAHTDLAVAVVPHVAGALRTCRRSMVDGRATADDGPAVVIISATDELEAADRRALDRLADLGMSAGEALPGVVYVLVARARLREPEHGTTAVARGHAGRSWLLDASLLDDQPHGTVAVIVQRAPDTTLSDALLRAYGLTERERQIATQVITGASTKAIAARLHVSPWTVQDHLKSIFDKSGVRNRGDLAALSIGSAV
jgi:DNA-binding CsgD family transcriptional regulator